METTLDQQLIEEQNNHVIYGTFWQRLAALLLDSVVVGGISFPLTSYNISTLKSPIVLVIITVTGLLYKPFMEYKYQATLGKMALNLIVVNQDHKQADLMSILLRNVFHVLPGLASLIISYLLFLTPDFKEVSSFMGYSELLQKDGSMSRYQLFSGLLYITDTIFLLSDNKKRALHDRMGKTYVIKKN